MRVTDSSILGITKVVCKYTSRKGQTGDFVHRSDVEDRGKSLNRQYDGQDLQRVGKGSVILEDNERRLVETEPRSKSNTSACIPVDMDTLKDVLFVPNGITQQNIDKYDLTGYINDVNQEYTQVLMEYNKTGNVGNVYDYGVQRNSVTYMGAQTFYAYDGRGSVANGLSRNGQSNMAYSYNEWGETVSGNTKTGGYYSTPYQYNAEATDVSVGLQYLRARYYQPSAGRFTQSDTYLGNIYDPLSQNNYIYTENNPLNFIDPSGLMPTDDLKRLSKVYNAGVYSDEQMARYVILRNMTKQPLKFLYDNKTKSPYKGVSPSNPFDQDYQSIRKQLKEDEGATRASVNMAFHEIAQLMAGKHLKQLYGGDLNLKGEDEENFVTLEAPLSNKKNRRWEGDVLIGGIYLYEVKPDYKVKTANSQLDKYIEGSGYFYKRGGFDEIDQRINDQEHLVHLFSMGGKDYYEGYRYDGEGRIGYYIKEKVNGQLAKQCVPVPNKIAEAFAKEQNNLYSQMLALEATKKAVKNAGNVLTKLITPKPKMISDYSPFGTPVAFGFSPAASLGEIAVAVLSILFGV